MSLFQVIFAINSPTFATHTHVYVCVYFIYFKLIIYVYIDYAKLSVPVEVNEVCIVGIELINV